MSGSRPHRYLLSLARIAGLSYLGITLLLAVFQRHYIYYPHRLTPDAAHERARVAGLEAWRDDAGHLIGWRQPVAPDAARVLVFHGNAGSALDRGYFVDALAERPADRTWRVAILEYPGYGPRDGRPSETAILSAAHAAMDALRAESRDPILLIGESLGSAVAARMASERGHEVAGLLLITPFPSLAHVAAVHYPLLPVRLLMRDRFQSARHLARYNGPVVVVVAGRDRVVPARLGRRLHAEYHGPSILIEQEDRDHNTLNLNPGAPWWNEAFRYLIGLSS